MCCQFLDKYKNVGFMIIRLGIGAMFIWHGFGKLQGGVEVWKSLGSAMTFVGIKFGYPFWGLMASLAEFLGGICLILGLCFRPACFFMFFTMLIATILHFSQESGLQIASHAVEAGILFLGLIFIGPGEISLDSKICKIKNKK